MYGRGANSMEAAASAVEELRQGFPGVIATGPLAS